MRRRRESERVQLKTENSREHTVRAATVETKNFRLET